MEVDFFRGLALLVIMLDHIPSSLLSHITLHAYAYCDAAEVFVYVGGYSTAAAFQTIDARQGTRVAATRFFRRAAEIYRAYLITAALMLVLGILFHSIQIDTNEVKATEASLFLSRPIGMAVDIVTMRRQPFLSSVLPMYAVFALVAPFVMRSLRRAPWAVAGGSVVLWLFAPTLARFLSSAYDGGWPFNPFAWQLIFVSGMMARACPVDRRFFTSPLGLLVTSGAVTAVIAFAYVQLFVLTAPSPGYEKQNLDVLRVLNFAVLAWCASWISVRGWIKRVAILFPSIVGAGRQSLWCFIAGACISVSIDGVTRLLISPLPAVSFNGERLIGGIDDLCAIVLLLGLARVFTALKTRSGRMAQKRGWACLGMARRPASSHKRS